jgi:hypothetical protein
MEWFCAPLRVDRAPAINSGDARHIRIVERSSISQLIGPDPNATAA